jgi:uncharacterized protein
MLCAAARRQHQHAQPPQRPPKSLNPTSPDNTTHYSILPPTEAEATKNQNTKMPGNVATGILRPEQPRLSARRNKPRADLNRSNQKKLVGRVGLFASLTAMQVLEKLFVLWLGAMVLVGCGDSAPPVAPSQPDRDPVHGHLNYAQPKLPTIKVWLGPEELLTEVARTDVQIATGMMFRTNMAENEAMLFVFPSPDRRSFYMRNCIVALSAAYITPDGTIAEIVDLEPGNEIPVPSESRHIQFVLEVPQGWFQRHNISPGAVLRTEKGTLQETFFRR